MGYDNLKNANDYLGCRFGNLRVVGTDPVYVDKTYNSNHWLFECDCGNIISEVPSRVLNGHKKSCGCRKVKRLIRHGLCNDPFYHVWWGMMQRCYNHNHHNYKSYGARGICVCDQWQNVENFISWAHQTYDSEIHQKTLDRIDNNKGYDPGNCKWSTPKEQSNNRRNTLFFTVDGVTKSLSEWCDEYRMPVSVVGSRIRVMGWDIHKALTTPITHFSDRGAVVEIDGVEKTIKEWCAFYGISRSTVYGRVRRGMDMVNAITTPLRK